MLRLAHHSLGETRHVSSYGHQPLRGFRHLLPVMTLLQGPNRVHAAKTNRRKPGGAGFRRSGWSNVMAVSVPAIARDPLLDGHGRRIGDLRVSVTDRCNFRCQYCMPAEGLPWLERSEILRFEEIERLVRLMVAIGIRDVRLTGGEPLVRREFPLLVSMLAGIDGLEDLSLTTRRCGSPSSRGAPSSRSGSSSSCRWTRTTPGAPTRC